MIERVEVMYGGINIAQSIERLDPRATMVNCLIQHHTNGKLTPILVTIDPQTWEITCPDDWQPVVSAGVITFLEREFGAPVKQGRGYHQTGTLGPVDEYPYNL